MAMACGACLGLRARLGAGRVARRARLGRRHGYLRLLAVEGVFEAHLVIIAKVGAARGSGTAIALLSAEELGEHVAEHVAEDVFRPRVCAAAATAAAIAVEALLAEAVIDRTTLRIAQDLVSLGHFLELGFRVRAPLVAVGMVLHRLLAEGGFENLLISVLRDAENIIIGALAHRDAQNKSWRTLPKMLIPADMQLTLYCSRTLATAETRWAMARVD